VPNFDLIVLGGGSAGFAAARRARQDGATVALVERGVLGGECPNTACVPAKALLRSAESVELARRSGEFGVRVSEVRPTWSAIQARMRRIIGAEDGDVPTEARLQSQGIAVFRGEGRLSAADTVQVGAERLTAPRIILTSGSTENIPPIPGLAETGYVTHREALEFARLPESLAIIGAGPVGVEFAQIFAPLGVEVTLIASGPYPLPREDHEVSRLLLAQLRRGGIRVETGIRVEQVRPQEGRKTLEVRDGYTVREISAAEVMLATGHRPVTEGMNLAEVGVEVSRRGVTVDSYLRTTSPHIWAAGDVTGVAMFTHVASYQGKLAARNALTDRPTAADYRVIPRATFCRPEVASVGLTEEQCLAESRPFRAASRPLSSIEKSVVEGAPAGLAKLIVEPRSGQILGAHVVASRAGELIHEIAVLMHNCVPVAGLGCTIHAFPTFSEIWEAVALELG